MDIVSLLYEQQIINQQISYFVLKEDYEDATGKVVTEGAHEAWEWIKDKVNKFIGLLKSWFGKIWTFLTKTFPGWIKKIVDNILYFLHLKKKPEVVDDSKIKAEDKEKVEAACDKANKANIVIETAEKAGTDSSPSLKVPANPENKEESKDEDKGSSAIVSKEALQQAAATRHEVIDSLETMAKTAPAEEKAELNKAVSAIKAKKQVVMSSKNSDYLQGPLIDLDKAESYMKANKKAISMLYSNITKREVFNLVFDTMKRGDIDKEISKSNPNANRNKIMNAREIENNIKKYNPGESMQQPIKSYTDCKKAVGAYQYSNYKEKKVQKISKSEVEKRVKQIMLSSNDKETLNMLSDSIEDALKNLNYISKNLNKNLSRDANAAINSYISFISKCSAQFSVAVKDITDTSKGIVQDCFIFIKNAKHVK